VWQKRFANGSESPLQYEPKTELSVLCISAWRRCIEVRKIPNMSLFCDNRKPQSFTTPIPHFHLSPGPFSRFAVPCGSIISRVL